VRVLSVSFELFRLEMRRFYCACKSHPSLCHVEWNTTSKHLATSIIQISLNNYLFFVNVEVHFFTNVGSYSNAWASHWLTVLCMLLYCTSRVGGVCVCVDRSNNKQHHLIRRSCVGRTMTLYSTHISSKLETIATERSGLVSPSQKREKVRSTEVIGCNWPPPCLPLL
jgi:hypothetical protein